MAPRGSQARVLTFLFLALLSSSPYAWQQDGGRHEQNAGAPTAARDGRDEPTSPPGITVFATPQLCSYVSSIAVQVVSERLQSAQLGTIETSAKVPLLGTVHLTLTNVTVSSIDTTYTRAVLSPEGGGGGGQGGEGEGGAFGLAISGMAATVDCRFHFRRARWPHISGGGGARVDAREGSLRLRGRIVNDGAGRPRVVLAEGETAAAFGRTAVHIHGTRWRALYALFASLARGRLRALLSAQAGALVTPLAAEVNARVLGRVPTVLDVRPAHNRPGLPLNISLAGQPRVEGETYVQRHWGRFPPLAPPPRGGGGGDSSDSDSGAQCPFVDPPAAAPAGLADLLAGSGGGRAGDPYADPDPAAVRMLYLRVSQAVVNCFTWEAFQRGMLHHTMREGDLPAGMLTTREWAFAVPQLAWRYPRSRNMTLRATALAPPNSTLAAGGGLRADAHVQFKLFVDEEEEKGAGAGRADAAAGRANATELFTLNVTGTLVPTTLELVRDWLPGGDPNGWRLALAFGVERRSLRIAVADSKIGQIFDVNMAIAAQLAVGVVEEKVNGEWLADGFALPRVPFVGLDAPRVACGDGALLVSSDLRYLPTAVTTAGGSSSATISTSTGTAGQGQEAAAAAAA